MESTFKALSLSYKNAPIEIREAVSLNEDQSRSLLLKMQDILGIQEALILSTCNRTEIYYSSADDFSENLIQLIGIEKGVKNIAPFFRSIEDSKEAVKHLFEVALGLDSQVVGDIQIINQVKRAYQTTADLQMADAFLHRLLHTIFFANKKVSQQTAFRDGAASVSYATVEMIEELTSKIHEPKILLIGLGEIGTDVARNLKDSSLKNIALTNRTAEKAQNLAAELGFEVLAFENLWQHIADFDVIICSVARPEALITKDELAKINHLSFKYFFDLSVPRSIEENIEDLAGMILYNVDEINNRTQETLQKRIDAMPQVRQIIAESMQDFGEWSQEMMVSPTINKLKNALEQIRKEEIARHLKQLNANEMDKVEKITKSIMQKIMKLPVLELKAACKRGEAETLVDVLNNLFNLEAQSDKVNA